MAFQFTFKHMESSEALSEYAAQKLGAEIDKFVQKPVHTHVTFDVEKASHHVHVSVVAGDGFNAEVDHQGHDMYAVIDETADKLEIQLKKQKEKLKSHKAPSLGKVLNGATKAAESAKLADGVSVDAIDAADILKFEESVKRAQLEPVTQSPA